MKHYLECGGRHLRRIPVFALDNDLSDVNNFNSNLFSRQDMRSIMCGGHHMQRKEVYAVELFYLKSGLNCIPVLKEEVSIEYPALNTITLLCGSIFAPKQSVFTFPICTLRCRFLRMSAIRFGHLPLTPERWSFFRSPFIQTESEALTKSMEITAPF